MSQVKSILKYGFGVLPGKRNNYIKLTPVIKQSGGPLKFLQEVSRIRRTQDLATGAAIGGGVIGGTILIGARIVKQKVKKAKIKTAIILTKNGYKIYTGLKHSNISKEE